MSELRWILIGFGIVLLAAIYLWGRRGNRAVAAGDDALLRVRPEPSMHGAETTLIRAVDDAPVTPPAPEIVPPLEPPPQPELLPLPLSMPRMMSGNKSAEPPHRPPP